ncbi:MAG: hypothetical protein WBP29_02915 [Candidatus Zixiibacteriota bacterium]
MKRFVISAILLVLLAASAGSAATLKSFMMAGPYAGYTLGLSGFYDEENAFFKASSSPGVNFGGNFHYGLSEKMMIGGEIYIQSIKYEQEAKDPLFGQADFSESESGTNFLFSALYAMSYMQRAMLMLNAGAGLYDTGDNDIGFFGGVMYQRMVAAKMSLFLLARLHFIMADDTLMMLQLAVGLHFWLGATGTPMS